ncbi:MAG: type III-B CRISPR module-associated Cmr3 family protein [Bacteroidota bacterium]
MPDKPYTHFVRLFPQGNYFFGNENYSDSEQRAFYFQKSRAFPQQTTLLGLIRYQLLLQNDMLVPEKGRKRIASNKAAALIGDTSFAPLSRESSEIPSFGAIEAISPVLLVRNNGSQYAPFPAFKDWEKDENKWSVSEHTFHVPALKESPPKLRASLSKTNYLNSFPQWGAYDVKKDIEWGFRNLEDGSFLPYGAVFETTEPQIGIYKTQKLTHRQKKDRREREGFFKMHFQRMKKEYGFGFYLRLDLLRLDPLQKIQLESQAAVIIGKERSVFRMEVEEVGNVLAPLPSLQPSFTSGNRIWLAGPARLDLSRVYEFCQTVVSREISFRCIQTSVRNTNNYHGKLSRQKQQASPFLSQRYNLLDAGSLLVLKTSLSQDEQDRFSEILADPVFSSIGYNHYLTY